MDFVNILNLSLLMVAWAKIYFADEKLLKIASNYLYDLKIETNEEQLEEMLKIM